MTLARKIAEEIAKRYTDDYINSVGYISPEGIESILSRHLDQEWVKVSERLPELNTWVAVELTSGMVVGHFVGGLPFGKQVKRWCPLPAPPVEHS